MNKTHSAATVESSPPTINKRAGAIHFISHVYTKRERQCPMMEIR